MMKEMKILRLVFKPASKHEGLLAPRAEVLLSIQG
jgi:hypothetical protein